MNKDAVVYPADSLLTDSCDVYGTPSTYWVGSTGTTGHTVTLTLPCTVTIDRQKLIFHFRAKNRDKTSVIIWTFFFYLQSTVIAYI